MEQLQELKARYQQLEQRQQYLVIAVAVALTIFLFMTLVYRPLSTSLESERAAYYSQTQLRDWMQSKVTQLKNQAKPTAGANNRGSQSATVLINQTASKNSIQISRSQPRSNNQYQIWLDKVTFNQLMVWLTDLQNDYGIHVHSINVSKAESDGQVRVNLTFQDGM